MADDVAALVADDLGWDDEERRRQSAAYRTEIEAERVSADLPAGTPAVAAALGS